MRAGKFPQALLLNGHKGVFVRFFAAKWNLMRPSATQMTFCRACWAATVSSCRNASPNLLQILIQIKRQRRRNFQRHILAAIHRKIRIVRKNLRIPLPQ
jgi:hypothetical protein